MALTLYFVFYILCLFEYVLVAPTTTYSSHTTTTTLNDRNFLMRALYKDMNYSQASSQH